MTPTLPLLALLLAAAPDAAALRREAARITPVELSAPIAHLPEHERRALAKLVSAAKLMDTLFLRQVWAGNETLARDLATDGSPLAREQLRLLLLYKGPWNRLARNAPFVVGVPEKPAGGSFYPPGASRADVEAWLGRQPEAARRDALGFFTTLRRGPDGAFVTVPYSVEYQGELAEAARLLREAAELTQQPTLKAFLQKRADAFLSNDYYASEVAWMELDASVEPTIGPYEVYEDGWFNAKAAFEAFVTVRDEAETQKLARFSAELQDIEDHLPIAPSLRNPKLGALAPLRAVNAVFTAGTRGPQPAAFNLPNDPRVRAEKGTKRVMLKNVQEAKFRTVLTPIARTALAPRDRAALSFDAFFTHVLMHELMHGLGPSHVAGGKSVREALREQFSALEEAKADVAGLWALQYLVDKGVLPRELERHMYATFVAQAIGSLRYGLEEAHAVGVAVQLNHLLDTGAVRVARGGRFEVVPGRIKASVEALSRQLMELQASGDRAAAEALLARMGVVRPEVQRVLERLGDVPVDIAPRFTTAERLVQEYGR